MTCYLGFVAFVLVVLMLYGEFLSRQCAKVGHDWRTAGGGRWTCQRCKASDETVLR